MLDITEKLKILSTLKSYGVCLEDNDIELILSNNLNLDELRKLKINVETLIVLITLYEQLLEEDW